MAGRTAWRFRDPQTAEVYFMAVNPLSDDGSHGVIKQTKYEEPVSTYRSAANVLMVNAMVIQDSPDDVETFSYSGTLYTKEEFDALVYWSQKQHPWELTDDLGREFLVYVTSFEPRRVRSAKFRWKHSYVLAGTVIRELGV